MKFRKKPIVIEASQWFRNGDHPEDACELVTEGGKTLKTEGKIVRYYRTPTGDDQIRLCTHHSCAKTMHEHGWIDTPEGGYVACPGDWIITGIHGERYSCKPDIFEATYEPVE